MAEDPRLTQLKQWANNDHPSFNKSDNIFAFGMIGVLATALAGGAITSYIRSKPEKKKKGKSEEGTEEAEQPEPTESDAEEDKADEKDDKDEESL